MAFTQEKQGGRFNVKSASTMGAYLAVGPLVAGSQLSETVIAAASWNVFPIAVTRATVVTAGDVTEIWQQGDVGKMIAGASLGAMSLVGVGSTNGVVAPLTPSGLATALGSALGAAGIRWAVGVALSNAAIGDQISVYINPVQII